MTEHTKTTYSASERIEMLCAWAQEALNDMDAELAAARKQRDLVNARVETLSRRRDAAHAALGHLRSALAMMKEGQAR